MDAARTDRERTATRLLRSSAVNSYDPEIEIDWEAPLAADLYFVPPHRSSLFGTETWERLTADERILLTRHEVASVASIGLWFETILMQMLIRAYYDQDPTSRHAQYALTEVGDECRHSVMFGRMIERIGAPVYRVGRHDHALGRFLKTTATGVHMYAATLLVEEVLDALQREAAADERVQPLVRMVSRIHVVEEARHVRYAREELARQVSLTSRPRLAYSKLILARTAYLIGNRIISPEVYRSVGLSPSTGRAIARANPHFRDTLRSSAARATAFLGDLGLIDGPARPLWQRGFLI